MRLRMLAALLLLSGSVALGQDEIRPNENLVVEGIPAIPVSIAEKIGPYTEFRSAAFTSWHPIKREMLISTRFGDTAQVHRVRSPGGDRTQLTFFPDRVSFAAFGPKSADFFLFTKDKGGDEFRQLYRYEVATGAITLLTDGGRSQNGSGTWSTSGERIAYGSTRRNGQDRDIYVMDPRDPKSDRLLVQVEGGGWGVADWSPDDRSLLVFEGISVNESYLWLVDAATGERKLLTPKGGDKVSYGGAEFAKDGKAIYVTTDRGSEFQRLVRLDLANGNHKVLSAHIDWDVDDFDVSPDGKTIAFVTNEDGTDVLHLLDTATGKERPMPKLGLGLGILGGLQWHEKSDILAFTFSSARSPSDVYTLEPASGRVQRWTESETGGLNAAVFSEPELVRWKSFDGRMISGFLYEPPAKFTGKRPVVINIHGGPEGQAQAGFLGRTNYYLNELGVAFLFPNVRGSSGFGKTFLTLDNAMKREDSVKDIGALLDWIQTRPELDADRVMVTGGSYGGYMTLAVATHYNDRIRASLDIVGVSNFVTFLEKTEAYRRDLRRVEYGDERDPEMRAFLLKIAPVNNAHKISKPLFVVQGKNDPRVPLPESEQMVATVRKNGSPVWYLMAKDEGHGFAKKKNQDYQFYATVKFMQEHLLN
jgi:Tol biopolymer transport system component/dienelactone hydrolase